MSLNPISESAGEAEHPLVAAVDRGEGTVALLRVVQQRMARAQAILGFMAEHPEGFDLVEDGRAITREVRGLRRFAELVVAEHRALGPLVASEPRGPQVTRVLDLLVERIVEVAHDVVPTGLAEELSCRIREAIRADDAIPWP